MDAHLARELFAWEMVEKYLPMAEARLAKRQGHPPRIDQEWISLAQNAAKNIIMYGHFGLPEIGEDLGRLFAINADLALDFLDFVRGKYLKEIPRAERWIMWNGLEIVVQGVRKDVFPSNMPNSEKTKLITKFAPKDSALGIRKAAGKGASKSDLWGPELIGLEAKGDISGKEFEHARRKIYRLRNKHSARIKKILAPLASATTRRASFFAIPAIPQQDINDLGVVTVAAPTAPSTRLPKGLTTKFGNVSEAARREALDLIARGNPLLAAQVVANALGLGTGLGWPQVAIFPATITAEKAKRSVGGRLAVKKQGNLIYCGVLIHDEAGNKVSVAGAKDTQRQEQTSRQK